MSHQNGKVPTRSPHIKKYTSEYRRELFDAGRDNLFFYCKGILGFEDMTTDLHWDLCEFLSSDWKRAMLCAFRGSLKSSIGNIGFVTHESLYIPNHSTKLVEQKEDNAKINHFRPIIHLFKESARGDFLYWLYGPDGGEDEKDMQRIPEGFKGWTKSELNLIQTDPLMPPAITYGGIESAYEGWHGNLVLSDDLEGADSDKSEVSSEDAYRFISKVAPPLLRNPAEDRILDIGTPHGDNPHVYRIKRFEDKLKKEGKHVWDIWWKEVIDSEGLSRWPERFTPGVLEGLKLNKELWDTQYMLRIRKMGVGIFDMESVRQGFYTMSGRGVFRYLHREWDIDDLDEWGYPTPKEEYRNASLKGMRFYELCDPKHKDRITDAKKPSEAAICVVGVAPDGHVFVVYTWADDVGLEKFAEKVFWVYRKFKPMKVSMEAIGAQTWFWDYAKLLQAGKYRNIMSLVQPDGAVSPLPPLTARLIEAERKISLSKEEWIIGQLDSWFSFGVLHLHHSQEHLIDQCDRFPDSTHPQDLLDCLSQFPSIVPKTYPSRQETLERQRKDLLLKTIRDEDDIVGYQVPWYV